MSEFAIVVEYSVMEKFFYLIKGELKLYLLYFIFRKMLSNDLELN